LVKIPKWRRKRIRVVHSGRMFWIFETNKEGKPLVYRKKDGILHVWIYPKKRGKKTVRKGYWRPITSKVKRAARKNIRKAILLKKIKKRKRR